MSTTLTSEQIESLRALEVYDEQGGKGKRGRRSSSLGTSTAPSTRTTSPLSPSPSPQPLTSSSSDVVPGNPSSSTETLSPFPIYADPSRSTYQVLQMLPNLPLSKLLFTNQIPLPRYLSEDGTMKLVGKSGRAVWRHLGLVPKGGVYDQNGGEVVFERDDATGKVRASFVHLMRNPADHTEIDELMKVASLRGVEAT